MIKTSYLYRMGEFGECGYAELPELAAKILELPYEGNKVSMFIILPDATEGKN